MFAVSAIRHGQNALQETSFEVSKMNYLVSGALACIVATTPALATEMVYQPVNPSFGGSPLNSSHLMATASAQKDATVGHSNLGSGTSGAGSSNTNTEADLFVRQLEGRLLSALAGQVTEAIFGDSAHDSGSVTFGSTEVSFERTTEFIRLVIIDSLDGTVTEIVVPQLVTD